MANEIQTSQANQIVDAGDPYLNMIERVISDPNADVTKLEKLWEMKKDIDRLEKKRIFSAAFAKMQPEFPIIKRTKKNHTGWYAPWSTIKIAINPILEKHGFSLRHTTKQENKTIIVTAILEHLCGHREDSSLVLPYESSGSKNEVQAIGSAQSYGIRYTGCAILGLATEDIDDDGTAAGGVINDEQLNILKKKLQDSKSNEHDFCKAYKVDSVDKLPASIFKAALATVQVKIERQNANN